MRSVPETLSTPTPVTTSPLSRSLARITRRRGTRSTMAPPNSNSTSWTAVSRAKPVPSWTAVAPSAKNWNGSATPWTKLPNVEIP